MAKKKKKRKSTKRAKAIDAAAHQAKRIFEGLPHASKTGRVYYGVLVTSGVPASEAKTIAAVWQFENSQLDAERLK